MKKLLLISLFFISYGAFAQYEDIIEKVRKNYAPDKRTAVFEVHFNEQYNSLVGKTNLKSAKAALLSELKSHTFIDSVVVMPTANHTFQLHAIVNVSVANLRTKPEESAELASQMLLGMPLIILEKNRGWYRVQCPDKYIGWVDGSTITQKNDGDYLKYKELEKVIFTAPYGIALNDSTSEAYTIRDLSFGNLMVIVQKGPRLSKVKFPDGKIGLVESKNIQNSEEWLSSRKTDGASLINNGKKLLGIPYLWGGTSFKGADCSGFTRMTYLSSGLLLPRDASQQALVGEKVSLEDDFSHLKAGDLLFFGNLQTSKVSHVALWMGNKSFIHSSGMVQINSFDKDSPDYDEYNLKRLLFVKRVDSQKLHLSGKNFYSF